MNPIFIGGCERSGTTLLGAMLGAHSRCVTIPESQFLLNILPASLAVTVDMQDAWRIIRGHWRFHIWNIDVPALPNPPPKDIPTLLKWLVQLYSQTVDKADAQQWIDHTGTNVKYAKRLFEWFPDAKLIHLVRDGRAVARSLISCDWGPNTIIEAARWWENRLSCGLAAEQHFGPQRVLRVQYEDLVQRSQSTMAEVCQFLDLTFHPEMLCSKGFELPAYTQSQHSEIGKKPNATRIDLWKTTLSPREVQLFEQRTGDLLQMLGYSLQNHAPIPEPTLHEHMALLIHERFQWTLNIYKNNRRRKKVRGKRRR